MPVVVSDNILGQITGSWAGDNVTANSSIKFG